VIELHSVEVFIRDGILENNICARTQVGLLIEYQFLNTRETQYSYSRRSGDKDKYTLI